MPAAPARERLAFQGATVIDVRTGRQLGDRTIVVDSNRVRAVGRTGEVPLPSGIRVIDARGKYVIPGLWDMHVHVNARPGAYQAFIASGITGVREMGQSLGFDSVRAWRREIRAGARVGPRTIGTSARLQGPWPLIGVPSGDVLVETPDDARHAVDSLHAIGVDFVKAYEGLAPEVFYAAAAEARRLGIPFVGHLEDDLLESAVSDSGQRSIEHVTELTDTPCWRRPQPDSSATGPAPPSSVPYVPSAECLAVGQRFIRNRTWMTPTLVTFAGYSGPPAGCPPDTLRSDQLPNAKRFLGWEHMVRMIHSIGIPLLAASDANTPDPPDWPVQSALQVVPGCSLHQELVYLTESGLTPLEALRAATLNPAAFLEATDSLGTVAAGKVADLLLLDADPLVDIRNTQKLHAVVADGRYYDRATLDRLAATIDDGRER